MISSICSCEFVRLKAIYFVTFFLYFFKARINCAEALRRARRMIRGHSQSGPEMNRSQNSELSLVWLSRALADSIFLPTFAFTRAVSRQRPDASRLPNSCRLQNIIMKKKTSRLFYIIEICPRYRFLFLFITFTRCFNT